MRTGECDPRLWGPGAEDPTKPGLLMHRTCDNKCALFKAAKFVVICYTLITNIPGLDRVVREVSEEVTLKPRKEEQHPAIGKAGGRALGSGPGGGVRKGQEARAG